MTTTARHPIIRYHGGKFRLAPWIIGHFPPHRIYTEAFGGAAGVLLQKPRSHGEVYNDLDGDVVTLFRVLRNPITRDLLVERLGLTPYARDEFAAAYEPTTDPVETARRLVVRAQMGFGSAGATKGRTGFRLDTLRNGCNAQHLWATLPDHLLAVAKRLQGVLIENRDAMLVLLDHDTPETLHYVDPPYVHSTRQMAGKYYRHEMTDADHGRLLEVLRGLTGMVVLSGYATDLYDRNLAGWEQRRTVAHCASLRGSGAREETLWLNPAAAQAQAQAGLFGRWLLPPFKQKNRARQE
ncbi:MAG: DNA adenine methylase [Deltaproteobacteria bacterium]|nr:DNA adenine methylase [Deltaproteobacteria bacterium]